MTKVLNNKRDFETKQELRDDFWYSIALLAGNISIIVKILIGLITDRKK